MYGESLFMNNSNLPIAEAYYTAMAAKNALKIADVGSGHGNAT
jgi:hypothetical protein